MDTDQPNAPPIHWDQLPPFLDLVSPLIGRHAAELAAITELCRCESAASPAVCFFAGRLVESAVTDAYSRSLADFSIERPSMLPALDAQIDWLHQTDAFDGLATTCIHEVRKAGNKARHGAAHPTARQAAFCLAMLKVALPQLATDFRDQLAGICAARELTCFDGEVHQLLRPGHLAQATLDPQDLEHAFPQLLRSPLEPVANPPGDMMNWVIRYCLDCNRLDLAGALLARFLPNGDPDNPMLAEGSFVAVRGPFRVQTLHRNVALRLSRSGAAEKALAFLEPLAQRAGYLDGDAFSPTAPASGRHAMAETLGILAGARKTIWARSGDEAYLREVADTYARALNVQPWNHYLAINAAACTAWLGDDARAHDICQDLLHQLSPLRRAIGRPQTAPWPLLTVAESLLLTGDFPAAVDTYHSVGMHYGSTHPGAIGRALTQLRLHARAGIVDHHTFARIETALTHPAPSSP